MILWENKAQDDGVMVTVLESGVDDLRIGTQHVVGDDEAVQDHGKAVGAIGNVRVDGTRPSA